MRDNFLQYKSMKSTDYICIFGGGAIRGIAYIGAVKALRELGINCNTLVGSSVGAIFASLLALNCSTDEIKHFLYDFNVFMFKDINFGIGMDFAFSKGDVFEEWIREKTEQKFYGEKYKKGENPPLTFKNIQNDLYIYATDLKTNSQFIFSKETTPDFEIAKAVRTSACFPGLMIPVEYEDKLLVDGDLAQSLPFWKSNEKLMNLDSRILEFRLQGARENVKLKSFFDYMNSVYSAFTNFCSEHIAQIYNDKDRFDYLLIDTKNVLLLDFNISTEEKDKISQCGYDATIEYFTKTLVNKKKKLLPIYKDTLTLLRNIKTNIKGNRISKVKKSLFEFIANISDDFCCLDDNFLQQFKNIKSALLANINDTNFLNITKLNNKAEYIKLIQGLIEQCEFFINDFEEYISKF